MTLTVRSSRLGLWSCGKSAVAATGVSSYAVPVMRAQQVIQAHPELVA